MILEYKNMINEALDSVDERVLDRIKQSLILCMERSYPILTFGNGGSAAIAEHWSCDHTKGIRDDVRSFPNVTNLGSNMSLMTAIANDISYDEVFSKQIEYHSSEFATVIAISSSGSSPNIVKGLKQAREKDFATIAFVGFEGGTILKERLADHIIHVKSNNYGVVEDCHHILMHVLAQSIRKSNTHKDPAILKL